MGTSAPKKFRVHYVADHFVMNITGATISDRRFNEQAN